jgi:hypothetical protein
MNEQEFYNFLLSSNMSKRKFRLFAVACCRHLWDKFTNEDSRKAVDAAEFYADGELTVGELEYFRQKAEDLIVDPITPQSTLQVDGPIYAADWVAFSEHSPAANVIGSPEFNSAFNTAMYLSHIFSPDIERTEEMIWQANLIKHMIGQK